MAFVGLLRGSRASRSPIYIDASESYKTYTSFQKPLIRTHTSIAGSTHLFLALLPKLQKSTRKKRMPSKTTNLPGSQPPRKPPPKTPPPPPPLEIDPAHPGTVVRVALAVEALFNVFLAHGMLSAPAATARGLFSPSTTTASSSADPLVPLLMQWIGVWTLATTVPLVLALPNGAGAVERREGAYAVLGAMEALWVPLLGWKVWSGEEGVDGEGVMRMLVVPMGVCLVWRGVVLWGKRGWLGGYRVKEGTGKAG